MTDATDYRLLLEDPRFRTWVLSGPEAEAPYWEQWLAADPSREAAVTQARAVLLALEGTPVQASDQYVAQKVGQALTMAKRQEDLFSAESQADIRPLMQYWLGQRRVLAAAATVLLLLGAGWVFLLTNKEIKLGGIYSEQTAQAGATNQLVEVVNEQSQPRVVSLPDGSSIVLQQHSRISYPSAFDGPKREVYLAGEAFFEVAKNAEKPFFVYANELVTKVLGTSFSVRAYADSATVDVAVKSGKVSVFAQTDKDVSMLKDSRELTGMVLLPNQQAVFQRSEVRLVRNLVHTPTLLALPIENQNFEFTEIPLSQVFATFEKAYGVEIVYDEELMAHCSITAKLGDEPLFTKLKWICAITEASYEVTDGQIIFTGKSCR